jgi:hypothetical protein
MRRNELLCLAERNGLDYNKHGRGAWRCPYPDARIMLPTSHNSCHTPYPLPRDTARPVPGRRFSETVRALALQRAAWLVLLVLLSLGLARAAHAENIGTVDRVAGEVTITSVSGESRPAVAGGPIAEGDSVATGADGEVLFKMVDSGAVALRPKTQMRFTEYKFESKPSDSSVINLVKGSVRALTGLIGKIHPEKAYIRTPAATVGIRGTDHETLVLLEDTPDGTAGTYDRVYDGSTYIEAENGQRVSVDPNQVGFSPQDALKIAAQLGLLRGVPRFFVTGRFDDLFAVLSQELQRRLQDRLNNATKGRLPIPIPIPEGIGNLFK